MSNGVTAATKASDPKRRSVVKRVLFVLALIILLLVPTIPLSLTSLGAIGSGGGILGTVVAVMGVRVCGLAKGSLVALFGAIALSLAPLGLVYPALGTIAMVFLGAICGIAAYRGMEAPFVLLSLLVSITMVMPNPMSLEQIVNGVTVTSGYILLLSTLVAISAVWGVLLGWLVSLKLPSPPPVPVQRELAMAYGATLALTTGTVAAVVLTWLPGTTAGWIMLTIFVVFIPRAPGNQIVHAMRTRAIHRSAGTVGGVLIAGLIAGVVRSPIPLFILGIILLIIAFEVKFAGRPYWQYVVFLTPAVVFLTGYGMDADRFGLMRLVCTAIGVIIALAALEFHRKFTVPWIERSRELEASQQAQTV